jgi:hypothetical protein
MESEAAKREAERRVQTHKNNRRKTAAKDLLGIASFMFAMG